MIANVGAVLKVMVSGPPGSGEPVEFRAQVVSDGPAGEPGSVWAAASDGGRNRFVLVKRVPKSEPAQWIGRWA